MHSFFQLVSEFPGQAELTAECRNLPVQLGENEDFLLLRVLAPGIPKESLQLEVSGQELTVSGRLAPERGLYHRQERQAGVFCRRVALSCPVDASRAEADLRNGVLTVRLPKLNRQGQSGADAVKRRIVPKKS